MIWPTVHAAFRAWRPHGIATSNLAPSDLYKEWTNRTLFLPFIGLLERQ
jgi:hypothetical protein